MCINMKNSREIITESQLKNTWKSLHVEPNTKEKYFLLCDREGTDSLSLVEYQQCQNLEWKRNQQLHV